MRLPAEAVRLPEDAVRLPEYFRGRKIALRRSDIACILAVTLPEVDVGLPEVAVRLSVVAMNCMKRPRDFPKQPPYCLKWP